jgi:octaheme c-type cytochrome (tetrathionate reductase family)
MNRWIIVVNIALVMIIGCSGSSSTPAEPGAPEINNHASIAGAFNNPQDVTKTCLSCHVNAGSEFMLTSHWTWVSDQVELPGGSGEVPFGKINSINNFCIAVPGNWARCTQCHAGYGWSDTSFDFSNEENIDCLVCHDTTGTYKKDMKTAGMPADDVDLGMVARNVGLPTRASCGICHFYGGGGDGVKHGDMDTTMADCPESTDVHMGRLNFSCQECHVTDNHDILGRLPHLNSNKSRDVQCTSCHVGTVHNDGTYNSHTLSIACQTCHIPAYAYDVATVMNWDWSTAGLEAAPDERVWNKKKGSFILASNVTPEYYWWNGDMDLYLPGQTMDSAVVTDLSMPMGDIDDPNARIWPFKVHRGVQPYDVGYSHFLSPKLFGPGGFWATWDWNQAFTNGADASGVEYSGQYGWAETTMFWSINHMVQAEENALTCMQCHGDEGLMPWAELGYEGDPMIIGGRW